MCAVQLNYSTMESVASSSGVAPQFKIIAYLVSWIEDIVAHRFTLLSKRETGPFDVFVDT